MDFMTSRGVPGGLLIAIFIMPILMIMTFVSFMMYVSLLEKIIQKQLVATTTYTGNLAHLLLLLFTESLDIDKKV